MEKRPKIKIELSNADKMLEIGGWAILLVLWYYTIIEYNAFPSIIPTHFNFQGQIDDYGSKATIILIPLIITILFIGLTFLNKYPHIFNYPTKVTEQNAEQLYTIATKMMRYLKFGLLALFSYIFYMIILSATGNYNGMGFWFLPLIIVLIFVPIIFSLIKMSKMK